ncbi:hypothetical protein [Xanthomonas oryzae]|uniref:Uncharacterized protein n=1 Tax=Xanthomonas oryzae pv. oryzae TaxID=64187 RepID=A0AAJ5SMW2_XANOO|nr:hypothetical protein [Xanthomonas oryzae]QIE18955.1 hypothetical protein IXO704_005710 [Xanthomonas oryzae pv. oryzae]UXV78063.1 hypothetical protein IXO842_005220 [Xanthomonas oryzae pv. oryzae]UXW00641.1 hypothetical protein IXO792_05210 [Xanthomonas oryzae pv. oryzae]UXW17155.1 hypothetical protein IXO365_005260 [Xanthomonas oryzae pv. oryzae]UXW20944.1 hypothetical protein IXO493_005250 [Xanthomonas oryzae pv. oryzae]
MKRRKFIQSSLVAGAAAAPAGVVAADQATRVFGQPASLTGGTANSTATKMLLPLSRGGMPAEGWDRWSKLTAAVVEMFYDPSQRKAFNANPQKFLASLGYDSNAMDAPTLALLVALSDPLVQSAALNKDYVSLFNYLHAAGALEKPKPDVLTQQMSKVLSSNLAMIKEALGLTPDAPLDAETVKRFVSSSASVPTAADLAAIGSIAQLIRVAPGQAVAGAFAVLVAAVEAAVGVQAALVLFNYVTFVTHFSVAGRTRTPGMGGEGISQSMSAGIFTGQMSRLDPDICDSCTVAQRAAAMLGAPELYSEHAKSVIRNEVVSFLRAMQRVGLIGFEESSFETVVDAVYQYGMRTITA